MKKIILLMDNVLDSLDVHARILENAGYVVLRSTTTVQAKELLQARFVDLAIFDIRMEVEDDPQDIGGLKLAEEEAFRSIPKIILTAYPSWPYAEMALGAALEGLQLVGMVDKADGPEALVQAVEKAFTQYRRINENLDIRWNRYEALSFPHLVTLIEPENDNENLALRISELEALFRRLFYDSDQINISQLFSHREGYILLSVFAYTDRDKEKQYVVSCGQKQAVENEVMLYEELVPKARVQGSLIKSKFAETTHFAATTYALTGGDLAEMVAFAKFYSTGSVEMVTTAVEHLFSSTLEYWYQKGRFYEKEKRLNDFFIEWLQLGEDTLAQEKMAHRLENICREALAANLLEVEYSPHELILHLPGSAPVAYPNPIPLLAEGRVNFELPFLCGTTHGRLDGNSILVNQQGETWLIDFSQVSQGPLVRDFVALETAIKFDLLPMCDAQSLFEMERRLLVASHLEEEIDCEGLGLGMEKAIQTITVLRHLASRVVGRDTGVYLGGLLFYAVGRLLAYDPIVRHTRHELTPYLHALLSATKICKKLRPRPREDLPSQALRSLWLDETNKEVVVEGREVDLSPQEFALLYYLYQHKGQLCSRNAILENVFAAPYGDDVPEWEKRSLEQSRINSTMSRLRRKLEPNPDYPKYLISVRGEGYRLELEAVSAEE